MTRTKYVMCPDCDGSGFVDEDGNGVRVTDARCVGECETCDGRGEILEGE